MKQYNVYDNKSLYGLNKTSSIFNKLKNGIEDNRDPIYEISSHMDDFKTLSMTDQYQIAKQIVEKIYKTKVNKLYSNQILDVWRLFNIEPNIEEFKLIAAPDGVEVTTNDLNFMKDWIWVLQNKPRFNQG